MHETTTGTSNYIYPPIYRYGTGYYWDTTPIPIATHSTRTVRLLPFCDGCHQRRTGVRITKGQHLCPVCRGRHQIR
jgi:hypothetical protein